MSIESHPLQDGGGLGEHGGPAPPLRDLQEHLPAEQERSLRDHVQRGDYLRRGRLFGVRAGLRHAQEAQRVSQVHGEVSPGEVNNPYWLIFY